MTSTIPDKRNNVPIVSNMYYCRHNHSPLSQSVRQACRASPRVLHVLLRTDSVLLMSWPVLLITAITISLITYYFTASLMPPTRLSYKRA